MSPSGDLPAYEAQKSGPRRSVSLSGGSLESPALVSNMLKDHTPMNEVDAGRSSFSPSATSRASTSNWGSAFGGVPPNCVVSNSGGGRSSAGGSSLGSGGEWGGRDYEINQSGRGSRRGGRDDHKRKSKRRKKGGAGGSRDGSDVESRNREKHFSKSKRRSSLGSSAQSDANSESGLTTVADVPAPEFLGAALPPTGLLARFCGQEFRGAMAPIRCEFSGKLLEAFASTWCDPSLFFPMESNANS
eukprot:g8755.t1